MGETATHGKVRTIPVTELQPGMKVEREVLGRNDKVLINAGEVITRRHVQQMQKWEKREKPHGPALPKKNSKNWAEPVRHGEFQGGWRPSHFNPRGVVVSTTLASGDEAPAVEKDPTLSPMIQNSPTKSFAAPDTGIESPLFRCRALQREIAVLEQTNAQLGGDLHTVEQKFISEDELTGRRDTLAAGNQQLIEKLKGNANAKPAKAGSGKPKGGK